MTEEILSALRDMAHHWETEYITNDGWPATCARQLREALARAGPGAQEPTP